MFRLPSKSTTLWCKMSVRGVVRSKRSQVPCRSIHWPFSLHPAEKHFFCCRRWSTNDTQLVPPQCHRFADHNWEPGSLWFHQTWLGNPRTEWRFLGSSIAMFRRLLADFDLKILGAFQLGSFALKKLPQPKFQGFQGFQGFQHLNQRSNMYAYFFVDLVHIYIIIIYMDEKCIYTYLVGDPIRSFGNATKEPRSVIFGRCQCHVPRRADHWSMQVGVEYTLQ